MAKQENFESLAYVFLSNLINITNDIHPDISKEHEILWKLNFYAKDIVKYYEGDTQD